MVAPFADPVADRLAHRLAEVVSWLEVVVADCSDKHARLGARDQIPKIIEAMNEISARGMEIARERDRAIGLAAKILVCDDEIKRLRSMLKPNTPREGGSIG